jgi:hypothetical protein
MQTMNAIRIFQENMRIKKLQNPSIEVLTVKINTASFGMPQNEGVK